MKLYNLSNSPFAARVRMQIRHKNLPIEMIAPPLPLRSKAFLGTFPLGKIPLLELPNGNTIAESTVIMDYLEALHSETALIPKSAIERAHNGMMIRCADNHLSQSLSPLFKAFFCKVSNNDIIAEHLSGLNHEIDKLENLLAHLPDFKQRNLQTGDICLATILFYVIELTGWFGKQQIMANFPNVRDWWQWVRQTEAVAYTIEEMAEGHSGLIARLTGASV